MFKERSAERELMDASDAEPGTYRFLKVINHLFGAVDATARKVTGRVLDVGGGDGAMAARLQRHRGCAVICVDRRIPTKREPGIRYVIGDAMRLPFRANSFDYAVSFLFLHHLDDHQVDPALAESSRVSRRGIVINDLVRSPLAWAATFLLTRVGDPMVRNDGPLSIKRSFRKNEILRRAQTPGAKYETHSFFRFTLQIPKGDDIVSS